MIMRSLVVLCISFISDDSLLTFCKGKKGNKNYKTMKQTYHLMHLKRAETQAKNLWGPVWGPTSHKTHKKRRLNAMDKHLILTSDQKVEGSNPSGRTLTKTRLNVL